MHIVLLLNCNVLIAQMNNTLSYKTVQESLHQAYLINRLWSVCLQGGIAYPLGIIDWIAGLCSVSLIFHLYMSTLSIIIFMALLYSTCIHIHNRNREGSIKITNTIQRLWKCTDNYCNHKQPCWPQGILMCNCCNHKVGVWGCYRDADSSCCGWEGCFFLNVCSKW